MAYDPTARDAARRLGLGAVVGAAAILVALPVLAQSPNCANPVTQLAMNQCAARNYEAADAELNAVYKQARARMKAFSPEAGVLLRDAQRAWIPFRDKACDAEGMLYQGGSIRPLIVLNCLERLTRQRIADLRELTRE